MNPNGDPATFTFTFDAFAENGDFAYFDIANNPYTELDDTITTVVLYKGAVRSEITTNNASPALSVSSDGAVALTGTTVPSTYTVSATESLCDIANVKTISRGGNQQLTKGSTTYWYII